MCEHTCQHRYHYTMLSTACNLFQASHCITVGGLKVGGLCNLWHRYVTTYCGQSIEAPMGLYMCVLGLPPALTQTTTHPWRFSEMTCYLGGFIQLSVVLNFYLHANTAAWVSQCLAFLRPVWLAGAFILRILEATRRSDSCLYVQQRVIEDYSNPARPIMLLYVSTMILSIWDYYTVDRSLWWRLT